MVNSPVLVLGATGQVGRALSHILGNGAIVLNSIDADLSKPDELKSALAKYSPTAVINAAAYTQVDKAEEEQDLANSINGDALSVIAEYAFSKNIPLVHYSTDYVFDGSGETPWNEDDTTHPVNAYGVSKLKGEKAIEAKASEYEHAQYLIFRTSWVYDASGKNFVNTMLRLAKEREELSVVNDQTGAPTFAHDIADYTIKALDAALQQDAFPSGVYHLTNQGAATWFEFANAIFEAAKKQGIELAIQKVNPIATSEYPTPAARPYNSRLNSDKLQKTFALTLPSWQDALNRCMEEIA